MYKLFHREVLVLLFIFLFFFTEREYLCLGQWEEDGITYTYTHRRDVDTYECFGGVVVNNQEIFIIEAGINCQRGLKPLTYGMKLTKQGKLREFKYLFNWIIFHSFRL